MKFLDSLYTRLCERFSRYKESKMCKSASSHFQTPIRWLEGGGNPPTRDKVSSYKLKTGPKRKNERNVKERKCRVSKPIANE